MIGYGSGLVEGNFLDGIPLFSSSNAWSVGIVCEAGSYDISINDNTFGGTNYCGVMIDSQNDISITSNELNDQPNYPIYLKGACSDLVIDDNKIRDGARGIVSDGTGTITDTLITNNYMNSLSTSGIDIQNSNNLVIQGGIIRDTLTAIDISSSNVVGCYITGIDLEGSTTGISDSGADVVYGSYRDEDGELTGQYEFMTWDYYITKIGSDYVAFDGYGNPDYSSTDFGSVWNDALVAMDWEGRLALEGGITYTHTTQTWVNASGTGGSGMENNLYITSVGGGDWANLYTTTDNLHGIACCEGTNVHLEKVHIQMKTTGTSGSAIWMFNDGGNAYAENGAFLAIFEDLKIEGGTSGTWMVYMEDTEWVDFRGRIYINGGSGVNGFYSRVTADAQYHYGSNLISGQIFVSCAGDDTTGFQFIGSSDLISHMNFQSSGRMWVINDVNDDNVTGMRLKYCKGSYFGGFMTERCDVALEMSYCKDVIVDSRGLTHLPRTSEEISTSFFDLNAGNYACTLRNIHVSFSAGSYTLEVIDDDQVDTNSPNMLDNWVFTMVGGTMTDEFGSTYFVQDDLGAGSDKYYRRLGSGTFP